MPAFTPEQWNALSPYLDQALEIAPGERAAWLDTLRKQNPTLAADLQTLLNEHHALEDEGFLEQDAPTARVPPSLTGQTVGAYTLAPLLGPAGVWAPSGWLGAATVDSKGGYRPARRFGQRSNTCRARSAPIMQKRKSRGSWPSGKFRFDDVHYAPRKRDGC